MVIRLRVRWLFALLVICLWCAAEANRSQAQGILRRLQDRVQSRIESVTSEPPGDTAAENRATDQAGSSPERGAPSPYGASILSGWAGEPSGKTEAASKPTMGIQVLESKQGTAGVRVAGIREGSRAGQAGLRLGDLIVAIDGEPTPTIESIAGVLNQHQVGDTLRATVMRGDLAFGVTIPLLDSNAVARTARTPSVADDSGAGASRERIAKPGIDPRLAELERVNDFGVEVIMTPGQSGVTIAGIRAGSSAAVAGLQAGDRIVSINGRLIHDEVTFRRELTRRHELGDELAVNVERNETYRSFDVVLRSADDGGAGVVSGGSIASGESSAPDSVGGADRNNAGRVGSVLDGLGSALGGWFGGQAARNQPAPDASGASESGNNDSIQRVGYEEELDTSTTLPSPALQGDPPSVEELTPPRAESPAITAPVSEPTEIDTAADSTSEAEKDQIIRSLREEIRRLQQRLKALEREHTQPSR